jgi:hypothetical protein
MKCIRGIIIASCLSFQRRSILHWLNVKREGGGGEILKKKLINSLKHRAADVSKPSVFLTGCIYMVFQARKTTKISVHYENIIGRLRSGAHGDAVG